MVGGEACPSIWFRCVDDSFSLFENKDAASKCPNIKFTMELKENQELPSSSSASQYLLYNSTPQKVFLLVFTLNGIPSHVESTKLI